MKTIFITGAASGIGAATARLFAREGYFVGIADVDMEKAKALAEELGTGKAMPIFCDVGKHDSVREAMRSFTDRTNGRLDVLYGNAGVLYVGEFEHIHFDKYQDILNVNAKGSVSLAMVGLTHLEHTPDSCMIFTSSAASMFGIPAYAVYAASKAFVRSLTESLNIEWEDKDIYVADIEPGLVATPMVSGERKNFVDGAPPSQVGLTAEDVAKLVWEAVTKREKIHYVIGEEANGIYQATRTMETEGVKEMIKKMMMELS